MRFVQTFFVILLFLCLVLNDRKANGDGNYEDDDGEYMYVPDFEIFLYYIFLQFFV